MADLAEAGIQPHVAWDYTLRDVAAALSGYGAKVLSDYRIAITGAYHAAGWARARHLPNLRQVLSKVRPQPRRMTDGEMTRAIDSLARAFNGKIAKEE